MAVNEQMCKVVIEILQGSVVTDTVLDTIG